MRKLILSLIFTCLAVITYSQSTQLRKREYFIDTDPGPGHGLITVLAYADSVTDTILSIPTTGLAAGSHVVYVRYADSTGKWGIAQSAMFAVTGTFTETASPRLFRKEYFIDTDPGAGNGTGFSCTVADSVTDSVLAIPTTGLAAGQHEIYFRFADSAGKWGEVQPASFTISGMTPPAEVQSPRLTGYEYFFDTDPGLGNGTYASIAAADSAALSIFSISTSGLSSGVHQLYSRFQDSAGNWSQVQNMAFNITGGAPPVEVAAPRIVRREYFVDTDPGPGNGTGFITASADSVADTFLSIPTTGLAAGYHAVFIRYADSMGKWGLPQASMFTITGATPPAEVVSPRIIRREYFFDTDPGAGNGISASFAATDSVNNILTSIPTTGLTTGSHMLYFRYADSTGVWGVAQSASFSITGPVVETAAPRIRKREYFIDTDPGPGSGTVTTVTLSDSLTDNITAIPTTGLSLGGHQLYVRYADSTGVWGSTQSTAFSVTTVATLPPSPPLMKREYFIDTDRGPGNGTVSLITVADTLNDTVLSIPTTGLALGSHLLYVRYADTSGIWGEAQSKPFQISTTVSTYVETQAPHIRKREYFIDTDPGPGNGVQVTLAYADSVADTILSIPTTGLAAGQHMLNVRYADSTGKWGLPQFTSFIITGMPAPPEVAAPRLIQREYFIDTDPGQGNGTVMTIATADSVSDTILSIPTTSLAAGGHILYVRYADSSGQWGLAQSQIFTVIGSSANAEVVQPGISKYEYYIDTDPGQGNGITVAAPATDSVADTVLAISTTGLTTGGHVLYFRYADSAGKWGMSQPVIFSITSTTVAVEHASPKIAKREYYIDTDPGQGNGTTYTLPYADSVADTVLSISTTGLASGGHVLYFRYADSTGEWGQPQSALFNINTTTVYVEPASPRIIKREYYIDIDPGAGNGTVTTFAAADSTADTILSIPTTGLAAGSHIIYVRYGDTAGKWGLPQSALFTIITPAVITEVQSPRLQKREYFFDTDPGPGNGTVSTFSPADSAADALISIPTTGLAIGGHIIYLRYADTAGKWGNTQQAVFSVVSPSLLAEIQSPPIVKGEYFIDTDPGEGNGTAMSSFPTADTASVNISLPTTGLTSGYHVGYVRFCDSTGKWTLTQPVPISVCLPAINLSPITGPNAICLGNTTTVSDTASAGTWISSNTAVATINTSGVVTSHLAGTTTITYSKTNGCGTAIVTQAITVVNSLITSSTTTPSICSGNGAAITVFGSGTYAWAPATGLNASTGASVIASPLTTTTYTITGTDLYGCVNTTTRTITVNTTPTVTSTPSNAYVCTGGSLSLSATGATLYSWAPATGLSTTTGASISAHPTVATVYTVSGIDVNGCIGYARDTISVLNPLVVPGIIGDTIVCAGASTTLSDSLAAGVWTSSNSTVASVAPSGIVSGIAAGTATITYSITSTCFTTSVTRLYTVRALPTFTLGSLATICQGGGIVTGHLTASTGAPTICNIVFDSAAHAAGFTDTTNVVITGSNFPIVVPATATPGTYHASISVSNGNCFSVSSVSNIVVVAQPTAAITSAVLPCTGYATSVVFTGTPGTTVAYTINGGTTTHATLTGGTLTLTTPAITSAQNYLLQNVDNGTCTTTINEDTVIAPQAMLWTGTADTNWNNAANWNCGVVPGTSDNVHIPATATHFPSFAASATGTANNVIIDSAARFTLGSAASLNIKGILTNNTAITGAGTIHMNGSSAQSIAGNGGIANLDINNTSGVSVSAGSLVTVTRTLSISGGTLTTNDSLVLASDSVATARIAAITATGARITGNVQVKQYIASGHRAYRFWAHPFSAYIPLSQLEQTIDVTGLGGASNGFTPTTTNAPSCFRYDPLTANSASSYDPGWKAFTSAYSTDDTNRFHQYQGIRLFLRGKKGEGLDGTSYTPSATVISMSGPVNQGNQTIHMQMGSASGQDYNQVGNPYASPVDVGTVVHNAKVAGNITGAAIYVWNPYTGPVGQFMAIPISSGAPYSLEANASFQVRAAHNGDTLNFAESNKTQTAGNSLLRTTQNYLAISVYDANYHPWDMLMLQFDNQATAAEDNDYDAVKPNGPAALNFYSWSSDKKKMAIDARPYEAGSVIPLGIAGSYAQDFIIKVDEMPEMTGKNIFLHDKLLSKYTQLQQGMEYHFNITADKTTQGDNRFELSLDPAEVLVTGRGIELNMLPNPASEEVTISFVTGKKEKVQLRIIDQNGVSVYENTPGMLQTGKVSVPLNNLAAGMYMVELTSGSDKMVKRLIKE